MKILYFRVCSLKQTNTILPSNCYYTLATVKTMILSNTNQNYSLVQKDNNDINYMGTRKRREDIELRDDRGAKEGGGFGYSHWFYSPPSSRGVKSAVWDQLPVFTSPGASEPLPGIISAAPGQVPQEGQVLRAAEGSSYKKPKVPQLLLNRQHTWQAPTRPETQELK